MSETPVCPACKGTRWVAPSPFHADREPWARYVGRAVAHQREHGYPVESYPSLTGQLRPVPCPECRAAAGAHEEPPPAPSWLAGGSVPQLGAE